MQSRTSFFNSTLFRKNLTRFWPLWGGASFLGALFPLALLLQLARNRGDLIHWLVEPLEMTYVYYGVLKDAVPVISLIYAVLCAMTVWSYLYNARSTGLMHTLPITRRGLFATNFLSGTAMMLIPYAVTGLLCVLLSLAAGSLDPVGLLYTILGVLGESFFYFASATLVAFVTGNIFALPVVYFLLHFLAPLLEWLLYTFAGNFLLGLSGTGSYSGVAEILSPTIYLESNIRLNSVYVYEEARGSLTGVMYSTRKLSEVSLENFWLIGVYALAGVVLLALAYVLYARRRSESAGDIVAVNWMKPLFRFGAAALAALLGGQALYALFWSSFQNGSYYDTLPMIICMLVAGSIGYYAASMLLAKSLRVFRGSWKGVALVAVGCIVLCCVLRFDLLGISRRVPEAAEVTSLTLYAADNTYTFRPDEDGELLEQVRQLHQAIVEDQEYIITKETWSADEDGDKSNTYIRLTYTLTNGQEVRRRYWLPLTQTRMAQEGTYDQLLDELVNSEAMKARRLHTGDSRYTAASGSLWLYYRETSFELSSREAAAILDAVAQDAAAGTWGDYDWFDQNMENVYAMELEILFTYADEQDEASDWISISVRPGMENTLDCLLDLGLVTEEDLLTHGELNEMYNDPASAGVIGGADGPSEVFVSG